MQVRSKYLKQLEDLEAYVARLGEKASADVRAAGLALGGDAGAGAGVLQGGDAERRLRNAIETNCLDVMLLQQPLVASDLRFVTGAFRMVSDLVHIDGMTREVALLAHVLPAEVTTLADGALGRAAEVVAAMVNDAVGAFLASDGEAAQRVFALDDEVDALYHQVEAVVVSAIRADSADVARLLEMLMAVKYFERMGDDAQRIAGWAVFRVTGEHEVYSGAHEAALDGMYEGGDEAGAAGDEAKA